MAPQDVAQPHHYPLVIGRLSVAWELAERVPCHSPGIWLAAWIPTHAGQPEEVRLIDKKRIREVMERVAGFATPVLSLYINTNPAQRESSPRAIAIRAKCTLDALALPHELADKVVQMKMPEPA